MFVLFKSFNLLLYEKVLRIPVPGSYRVCCYHCLPLGKCNSLVITFTDTPGNYLLLPRHLYIVCDSREPKTN